MVGVLAGVVLGNGVHCAGGMTAMAIKHAASSRMPASIAQSLYGGGHRVLSRTSSPLPPRSLGCGAVKFLVCMAEVIDGLLLG